MAKVSSEGGNARVISQRFENRKTKKGRICLKCNKDISLDEYGANKSWCLPCVRLYQKSLRDKKRKRLW